MGYTTWTTSQWAVFSLTLGAGVVALAFAVAAVQALRTWTAPATFLPASKTAPPKPPRPSLVLAARRKPVVPYDMTAEYAVVAEHLAPGPGSLVTLASVAGHVHEDDAWVAGDVFDVEAELRWHEMLTAFRVAVEPPMRKARLWDVRGQEGHSGAQSARAQLAHWRIDTPTGEWPTLAGLATA